MSSAQAKTGATRRHRGCLSRAGATGRAGRWMTLPSAIQHHRQVYPATGEYPGAVAPAAQDPLFAPYLLSAMVRKVWAPGPGPVIGLNVERLAMAKAVPFTKGLPPG